jgi:cephalosporin-C deacetylase
MSAFDEFWADVDAELERYPMAAELRAMPEHSAEHSTTYFVRLTSIGPYRVSGYYCVPNTAGPHPGLLLTPRYGSVNHVPDYWDRERYAVLQLIHRGQRLADRPFAAAYPGLLTLGIESARSYVYRGIVADCLRGAEFLAAQPAVDRARIAAQGDDLAVLTAARRPSVFMAVLAEEMLLYRLLDAAQRGDAYPVEEVNDYMRSRADSAQAVAKTVSYFDARQHAPHLKATVMLPVGDDPSWLEPLRSALGQRAETYQLTHRGAEDHDALDAWLASKLGARPRSRFLERVR